MKKTSSGQPKKMREAGTRFVEVAPAIPLAATSGQAYTYRVPEGKRAPELFSPVRVQFGPRRVSGIVVDIHSRPPRYKTKEIGRETAPALTDKQIKFARWIARTMHGGLGFTLRLFLPPVAKPKSPSSVLRASPPRLSRTARQILTALKKKPVAYVEAVTEKRLKTLADVAAKMTAGKGQALILLPEKWMLKAWEDAAPAGAAFITADMRPSELAGVWQGVRAGSIRFVIGTQKALFLPYKNLKLVVLEEEQFSSHKLWDQYPRLANRYAVRQLTQIHGANLLYASSFPSWRLRHEIRTGVVEPVGDEGLVPRPSLVASSFEDRRQKRLLPNEFVTELRNWLGKREKVLILYNRRDQRGANIQIAFKKLFPKHHKYLSFGTFGLLTEASAYGFDRLVWLFPESTLTYPDYRTYERALITLARLEQTSPPRRHAVIVTRNQPLIEHVFARQVATVVSEQLKERERLNYPPFADLIKLTVKGTSPKQAVTKSKKLRAEIEQRIQKGEYQISNIKYQILGPFHELGPNKQNTMHLLLAGDADTLPDLYHDLPFTSADLDPQRIL